jgi:hypothetical protein
MANSLRIDVAGGRFDVIYSPTSVTLANFVATPEPTMGLWVIACSALMGRRQRRTRAKVA